MPLPSESCEGGLSSARPCLGGGGRRGHAVVVDRPRRRRRVGRAVERRGDVVVPSDLPHAHEPGLAVDGLEARAVLPDERLLEHAATNPSTNTRRSDEAEALRTIVTLRA